jgi:hypothetical protein
MNSNEVFSEKINKLTQLAENILILLEALDRIAAKITGIVNACTTKSQQQTSPSTEDNRNSSNTRFFY